MKEEKQQIILALLNLEYLIVDSKTGELYRTRQGTGYCPIPKKVKGFITVKGYRQVTLKYKGRKVGILFHSIIYIKEYGIFPHHMNIHHKDSNKLNNKISNLELTTASQNSKKAFDDGLINIGKGEASLTNKLTENDVKLIRTKYYREDITYKKLARQFNVHLSTIAAIITRKNWSHI